MTQKQKGAANVDEAIDGLRERAEAIAEEKFENFDWLDFGWSILEFESFIGRTRKYATRDAALLGIGGELAAHVLRVVFDELSDEVADELGAPIRSQPVLDAIRKAVEDIAIQIARRHTIAVTDTLADHLYKH
jgi:hypothetical protein